MSTEPATLPPAADGVAPAKPANPPARESFWPHGWWRWMERRVGVVPLPVLVALIGIVGYFVWLGKVPAEMCMMIAVIGVGGFLCAEVGKHLPLLKHIGGAAICATFVPSALAFYGILPDTIMQPVADFTKSSQFLYVFITAVIVGSILGMDRRVLIRGFVKIFVPLAAGSLAALIVGTAVGTALGLGARHTLLFVVVPIMAGGVGEGAIPLSTGYAELLHVDQGELFAQILPPVMFGSLTAVVFSGLLNFLGKKFPHLTGEGRLQPGEQDDLKAGEHEVPDHMDIDHIAAAGMFAVTLYLAGLMGKELFGFPAPVTMLFLAVAAKLAFVVPPRTQAGAYVVYRFFRIAVTYPLLFAIGGVMTPWDKLIAAFHWANLVTIVATVATLMTTGWIVGRWVKLYPLEAAIVNACHSGQGGTGDVAILTAANRMQLMPFAQIATRIGGALTVTLTLLALRALS
ncbi:MAG: 2-hydroxycarboxylate transporter family protein [Candidatus Didemnitutus sp.]|nr:2-hydroxycarboxylate transporter family protein [Candidatus Didemnitutus sp.]